MIASPTSQCRGIAAGLRSEHGPIKWSIAALALIVVVNAARGRMPLLVLGYGDDAAEDVRPYLS